MNKRQNKKSFFLYNSCNSNYGYSNDSYSSYNGCGERDGECYCSGHSYNDCDGYDYNECGNSKSFLRCNNCGGNSGCNNFDSCNNFEKGRDINDKKVSFNSKGSNGKRSSFYCGFGVKGVFKAAKKVAMALCALSVAALIFAGCEVGLGEELDLAAPRLTIANYKSGEFVDTEIKLSGSCVDEGRGTESVVIEQLASDGTFKEIKRANVHGDSWDCTLDFSEGESYDAAGVGDGKSTLDIDGKVEGTKILRITATDKAGNVNGMSIKQILFFVDKTPPKGSAWYIDRLLNGITYNFLSDTDAVETSKRLGIPGNKDAAQNVLFTICGTMSDTMGVNDAEISLWEFDASKKGTDGEFTCVGKLPSDRFSVRLDEEGNPTSYYTPQFDISHDKLVELGKSMQPPRDYSTGIHIFQARYYAEDVVTNPRPNSTVEDIPIGYFIWQSESDNPHVELSDNSVLIKDENGEYKKDEHGLYEANYNVNSTIMLNIFDDDALNRTYWAFMGEDRYNGLVTALKALTPPAATSYLDNTKELFKNIENYSIEGGTPSNEKPFTKILSSDEREYSLSINTGDSPGTFHLVVLCIDGSDNRLKDEDGADVVPIGFRDLKVFVRDSNAPMLFITQPQSNTAPIIDNLTKTGSTWTSATFKVAGQVMDTKGCQTVDFVWVPDYVEATPEGKTAFANAWLYSKEYKGTRLTNKHINETLPNGAKMWSVKRASGGPDAGFTLTEPQKQIGSLFLKQTFEFNLDALSDFKKDATNDDTRHDKFFAILASRINESGSGVSATTYGEHVIAADNEAPIITVEKPTDGQSLDKKASSVLEIEFYAKKATGIPIDESKYELRLLKSTNGSWVATPVANLSGGYVAAQADKSVTIGGQNYAVKCFKLNAQGIDSLQADGGTAPTFEFYAEDIFGNSSTAQTTVSIGDAAKLMSITAKYPNNRTFKIGDEIEFNAVFNGTVKVAEADKDKIKLKLTGISKNGTLSAQKATFKGANGNTLIFSYTVAEGDASSKVDIDVSTDGGTSVAGGKNPFEVTKITIDSGTVDPVNNGEIQLGTLLPRNVVTNSNNSRPMTYRIDGSRPIIEKVALSTSDGVRETGAAAGGADKFWCKAGKTIGATLTLDKACNVTGDPKLKLKVTNLADSTKSDYITLSYKTSVKSGGKTSVRFERTVASSDFNGIVSFDKANSMSQSDIDSILSTAGNASNGFGSGISGAEGDGTIEIDTVPPATPTIKYYTVSCEDGSGNVTAKSPYLPRATIEVVNRINKKIVVEIKGLESGATCQWMNKGSWIDITSNVEAKLEDGEYEVSARQFDKAGNISSEAGHCKLDIASKFPDITINCSNADGYYTVGRKLNFTLTLSRPLTKGNATPRLQISSQGTTASPVSGSAILNTRTIQFEYTVVQGDDFTVDCDDHSAYFAGYSDNYGNSFSSAASKWNESYSRPGIHVDGSSPIVEEVKHVGNADGTTVKITFNKIVNKGSGKIVLRQASNWVVPPVMSVEDFNIVYNNTPAEKKQYLIRKDSSGNNILDGDVDANDVVGRYHGTGVGVGPYVKTTNGVNLVGGNYEPDIDAKYVLRFDFDAGGTNAVDCSKKGESSVNISMAQVREAFRSSGYSKREIDVTNANVVMSNDGSGKSIATITFGSDLLGKYPSTLEPGRLWEVVLAKGSFIDKTGNEFGAGQDTSNDEDGVVVTPDSTGVTARFKSSGADLPFIRTERYSYGRGMAGPTSKDTSFNKKDDTLGAPTGKIRVRLDCQALDTVISYRTSTPVPVRQTGVASPSVAQVGGDIDADGVNTYHYSGEWGRTQDYYFSKSAKLSTSTSLNGAQSYARGDIFIIDAFAGGEIGGSRTLIKAITPKGEALEGVYCSVVCFNNPAGGGNRTDVGIHGTTWVRDMGETPQITGFPLIKQKQGTPYVRKCYDNGANHYWVTFEIITKACIGIRTGNWGVAWGPLYYGGYTWASGCAVW